VSRHHQDRLREEVELKQRNTVWPDTLRNALSVDEYLWKGNPKAPLVQRIGAVIWGVSFLVATVVFGYLASHKSVGFLYVFAAAIGYGGLRMICNAFMR
jgi:hypothetical protein